MNQSSALCAGAALLSLLAAPASAQCQRWSPGLAAGNGPNGTVRALAVFDDGSGPALYAGGDFTMAGGVPARGVARWDGSSWSGLGSGLGPNGLEYLVTSLGVFDDGSGPALYASGRFSEAGGSPAHHIAAWDGTTWSPLGVQIEFGSVRSFAVFDDGSGPALYAGGAFSWIGGQNIEYAAAWDGTTWSTLGSGPNTFVVDSLAVFDAGNGARLFAGGSSAPHLEAWDGLAWTTIPGGIFGRVLALAPMDLGDGTKLYAGGAYFAGGDSHQGSVAAWDGSSWSRVGDPLDGPVHALAAYDDGDGLALYAAGEFHLAGGASVHNVARWDGTAWMPLGSGTNARALAMTVFDDGSGAGPALHVGGEFAFAGGLAVPHIASWTACDDLIDTLCFGDGTVAACPCLFGAEGRGCANSAGAAGAALAASGTTAPDTIVLQADGEPQGALTFFLQGDAYLSGSLLSGSGLRCVGGRIKRLYVHTASGGSVSVPAAGDLPVSARSASLGDPIAPGSLRFYQALYRDPVVDYCPIAPDWNLSNGVRIRW